MRFCTITALPSHRIWRNKKNTIGKMIARQNPNFKDGRPKKYMPIQIEHALSFLSSGKSYKEVEAITGISKSTMIRAKNKEGAV